MIEYKICFTVTRVRHRESESESWYKYKLGCHDIAWPLLEHKRRLNITSYFLHSFNPPPRPCVPIRKKTKIISCEYSSRKFLLEAQLRLLSSTFLCFSILMCRFSHVIPVGGCLSVCRGVAVAVCACSSGPVQVHRRGRYYSDCFRPERLWPLDD